jgi:hypothetical protein
MREALRLRTEAHGVACGGGSAASIGRGGDDEGGGGEGGGGEGGGGSASSGEGGGRAPSAPNGRSPPLPSTRRPPSAGWSARMGSSASSSSLRKVSRHRAAGRQRLSAAQLTSYEAEEVARATGGASSVLRTTARHGLSLSSA